MVPERGELLGNTKHGWWKHRIRLTEYASYIGACAAGSGAGKRAPRTGLESPIFLTAVPSFAVLNPIGYDTVVTIKQKACIFWPVM
jgi:hypothetical protein